MTSVVLREGQSYPLDQNGLNVPGLEGPVNMSGVNELLAATFLPVQFDRDGAEGGMRDEDVDPDEAETEPDGRRHVVSLSRNGREIQVGNLVGAFALPCGLQVEILPKVGPDCPGSARLSLRRMWSYAMDLALREHDQTATVEIERTLPLHEWLLKRFVEQLNGLVAKGLRSHYVEQEDNLLTLRGRLIIGENIRRNAFAAHRFYCRFDEFSLNRPENRLIRSALDVVVRETSQHHTRKRAAGLRERMHEIPVSHNVTADFAAWRTDRSMAHYQEIRQTCEWLLQRQSSAPVGGAKEAWGRVVRMNDVFERYVTRWLSERGNNEFRVFGQGPRAIDGTKVLARASNGNGTPIHTMRPDIVIRGADKNIRGADKNAVAVLDVKWKAIDSRKPFSREDLYQLFAYAQHWLGENADEQVGNATRVIAAVYPCPDQQEGADLATYDFPSFPHVKLRRIYFRVPTPSDTAWNEGIVGCGPQNPIEWIVDKGDGR